MLLLAAARAVAEVLSSFLCQSGRRPHWLQNAPRSPRRQGHGEISEGVGGVRVEAAVLMMRGPPWACCPAARMPVSSTNGTIGITRSEFGVSWPAGVGSSQPHAGAWGAGLPSGPQRNGQNHAVAADRGG